VWTGLFRGSAEPRCAKCYEKFSQRRRQARRRLLGEPRLMLVAGLTALLAAALLFAALSRPRKPPYTDPWEERISRPEAEHPFR